MYRAATWQAIQSGISVSEETDLTRMAESMHIALQQLNGSDGCWWMDPTSLTTSETQR